MATLRLGILNFWSSSRTCTQNAPFLFAIGEQKRRAGRFPLLLLIFVDNHSINHHVVACANVMNPDWSADFHSGPYNIFIEHLTAPRHVRDGLTKW